MDKPLWMWGLFLGIVIVLLIFDLGLLHRKQREIGVKESLWLSLFYICMGSLFGVYVWMTLGAQSGKEYFTGFLVEKSLSLDNVFVISLIFTYFAVPRLYQHRVLFWGILGVIVLRGIMIGLGAALVAEFHWVLYIFAVFLIFTGIKMLFVKDDGDKDLSTNKLLLFLKKRLRVTNELHGQKFFVKRPLNPEAGEGGGKLVTWCTPLFIALIFVEIVDLIFAVDSVPAIFTITTDPYIVYTSNIFAILGLRALYFALAAIIHRFQYLKYALSLVLVFIGSKIFIADFMGWEKFPAGVSLGITFGLLAAGVIFSLFKTRGASAAHAG
jgi:tellurite resistance protein TerC